MLIIDGESNDIVEKFPVDLIQQPLSFNYRDHMYDNILIFTVQHPDESQGNQDGTKKTYKKFSIHDDGDDVDRILEDFIQHINSY